MAPPRAVQLGGAVRPEAWYVPREADRVLPERLRAGELCAVLAPRQMGKSSLRLRAARTLSADRRCVTVDLTALGSVDVTAAGWFAGLAAEVAAELGRPEPGPSATTPARAWLEFLGDVVTAEPVVLFLDEIDALRHLPFAADVLGSLRAATERAATDPRWARLTLCLLGAVTPDALAAAAGRGPFNVGHRVALRDFTRAELLAEAEDQARTDEVHAWTSGHPFQTARLLAAAGDVEAAVRRLFFAPGALGDTTLAAAERELTLADGGDAERLELYARIRRSSVPAAGVRAPLADALVLTGMVALRDGALHPRNRVFATVFDEAWAAARRGRREVAVARAAWHDGGERDEDLPRGRALDALRTWADGRTDLSPEEGRFLLRAGEAAAAEVLLRSAEERRVEAVRVARARGRMVVALAAVGVLLAGASALAVREGARARAAARVSEELRLAAEASALAGTPRLGEEALRRALAASAVDPGPDPPAVTRALADVLAGTAGRRLRGHGGPVRRVRCEGATAVSEGADGARIRWRLADGVPVGRWAPGAPEAPEAGVDVAEETAGWPVEGPDERGPARLSEVPGPDGTTLRAGPGEGLSLVGEDGAVRGVLAGHSASGLRWAAFTPRGLLTLGHDDTLRRWDPVTGEPLGAFLLHDGEPSAVSVCPGALRVVTAGSDGTVGVWELAAGAGRVAFDLGDLFPAIAWSGETLVGVDPTLHDTAWSLDGAPAAVPSGATWVPGDVDPSRTRVFQGDPASVRGPDGVVVLPGAAPGPWFWGSWSADGRRLAAVSEGGTLAIWDVVAPRLEATWAGTALGGTPVFAADGRVAVGSRDGEVVVWDGAPRRWQAHRSAVTGVDWSPDGTRLATASLDHGVAVWNAADGALLTRLDGHASHARVVAFSPDGRRLASGGDDRTVRVWDTEDGAALAVLRGHTGVVRTLRWSADGRDLVSVADDGLVVVFPASPDALVALARARLDPSGDPPDHP